MSKSALPILLFLLVATNAKAATYWVSATGGSTASTCAQAQSTSDPGVYFRTIQPGLNCATAAGDTVTVKAGTYTQSNLGFPINGSSGNPITLKANTGDTVTLQNAETSQSSFTPIMDLTDRSHVRVEGLRFQGNRTRRTVQVWSSNGFAGSRQGLSFINNTFHDNGVLDNGDGACVLCFDQIGPPFSQDGPPVNFILGNTFTDNYGYLINLGASRFHIANNTGSGQAGSVSSSNGGLYTGSYIAFGGDNGRHLIENNHFHSFRTIVTSNLDYAFIRGDSGCWNSTIRNNILHDNLWGQTHNNSQHAYGILLEARCHNNVVKNNIIYNVSRACISIGFTGVGQSENVTIDGNTCFNSNMYGIDLDHAKNALVQNNVIMNAQGQGGATVFVSNESIAHGGHTFRNNLYFRSGVSTLFRWGGSHYDGANANFSSWQSSSGETNSLNSDPLFVNPTIDFHPQSGSPAIKTGFGGVNMGAFPSGGESGRASVLSGAVRLNAGGGQYSDSSGHAWSDAYFIGGYTYQSTNPIVGTIDDPLYHSERYGNFSYKVPVPSGKYDVALHFAEIWWDGIGQRLFNVSLEGSRVLSQFDIAAASGGPNTAVVRRFVVDVTDGVLDIDFTTLVDNAKVSAIEIVPTTVSITNPTSPPAAPSDLSAEAR